MEMIRNNRIITKYQKKPENTFVQWLDSSVIISNKLKI
jgi:hypothetical protein